MGQYFKIVNLTRKQYFSANVFAENVKKPGILVGTHAYALGKLITWGLGEDFPTWKKDNAAGVWFGCWAGDRIAIIGDETQGDFADIEAFGPENQPSLPDDIISSDFENISGKLICWLVNDPYFAECLHKKLLSNKDYLGTLGYIVYKFRPLSDKLIIFLNENYSKYWEKACSKIWNSKHTTFIEPNV